MTGDATTGLNIGPADGELPHGHPAERMHQVIKPVRWPADVVASVSAALAGVAVHTAAKQHLALDPAAIFAISVMVFAGLIGLHLVLRIEPPVSEKVERKRKKKPKSAVGVGATQDADEPAEPSDLALALTGRLPNTMASPLPKMAARDAVPPPEIASRQVVKPVHTASVDLPPLLRPELHAQAPAHAAASPRKEPAPSGARQPASLGFDKLQVLVAELARSTPGPKADSPDPDRVTPVVAAATERTVSETFQRSHTAQADAQAHALADAARIMQRATPPVRSGLAAALADALEDERMTVYLEPIQQMAHGRPGHYEISIRFRGADGLELPHDAVLAAARYAGLLPRIDAAMVPRAARIAQHFQLRGRDTDILARVHAVSLPDHEFRAEVTAAAIAADGAAPVLSFAQSDVRMFGRIHWDILSTLADMGVRFAIESVTDLDMDLERLKRQGFAFAKLDKDVLLRGLPAPEGTIPAADVCRHFANAGLALIVNHIDDDAALARILGFGVLFGQGSLFGAPRAVRDDLLSRSAA
jgi:cyclic-di-GMP phosphodiesterase, flagellum assembly factor TipF